MLSVLGKFFLVLGLCLQGSFLIYGEGASASFNLSLGKLSSTLPFLQSFHELVPFFDQIRFALVGLYFSSIFILLTSAALFPILSLLGVLGHSFIFLFPLIMRDPSDIETQIGILKNLAVVGGLLYLIGSSCPKKFKIKQD